MGLISMGVPPPKPAWDLEPEPPFGEVELVNASRRRKRQFNQQQALAYAVARYGSGQLPLGDPFEPMDQLVARAERWAEQQWRAEPLPPPPPDPVKWTWR